MTTFTPDQWLIIGLVFVLGLLVGAFMTAGGRRKWKTRYHDEIERRKTLEREHKDREAHWSDREKEWRDQDARRAAAIKTRGPDMDADGVPDDVDRRPTDDRRA